MHWQNFSITCLRSHCTFIYLGQLTLSWLDRVGCHLSPCQRFLAFRKDYLLLRIFMHIFQFANFNTDMWRSEYVDKFHKLFLKIWHSGISPNNSKKREMGMWRKDLLSSTTRDHFFNWAVQISTLSSTIFKIGTCHVPQQATIKGQHGCHILWKVWPPPGTKKPQ